VKDPFFGPFIRAAFDMEHGVFCAVMKWRQASGDLNVRRWMSVAMTISSTKPRHDSMQSGYFLFVMCRKRKGYFIIGVLPLA
jgi:hypothetical protein